FFNCIPESHSYPIAKNFPMPIRQWEKTVSPKIEIHFRQFRLGHLTSLEMMFTGKLHLEQLRTRGITDCSCKYAKTLSSEPKKCPASKKSKAMIKKKTSFLVGTIVFSSVIGSK